MKLPPAYCGLFLFTLVLAISFGGAQVFGDPDTAWHLAAGDLIRELGHVPYADPWSYVTRDNTWYNLSWLFDVGFSAAFSWGGFTALYAITLLAFAGSLVFMAHHCVARGASLPAIVLSLSLALLLTFNSVLARPNLCSIVLTVIFYHLLTRYRDTGKTAPLALLPLLMALWANLHGGFLLVFPMLGIFLLEALSARNRVAARAYGVSIALCMAATLLNPYGYEVYFGALKTLTGSFDKTYLIEWQPAKTGQDIPLTLLLITMVMVSDMRDKRIALSDRLLAVFMLLLAMSSMRHAAIATALTMPYISLRLTGIVQHSSLTKRESSVMNDMHKTDVKWMGVFMAVASVALIISPFPRDMLLKDPPGFPAKSFPVEEAAYIEKHYPHARFMTDYNIGGYLDYLWRGKVKVFVDGRSSSLFDKETLQDYADFAYTARGYGGKAKLIANQYRFDGVVIPNDDPASGDWHWNPDWKLVFQGKVAAVYVRSQNPPAKL